MEQRKPGFAREPKNTDVRRDQKQVTSPTKMLVKSQAFPRALANAAHELDPSLPG